MENISWNQLYDILSSYMINEEDRTFYSITRKEDIYINVDNLITTFLYILTKEFGDLPKYVIDLDESHMDASDAEYSEANGTLISDEITQEWLMENAEELSEFNVQISTFSSAQCFPMSRLVILSLSDLATKESLCKKLQKIYSKLNPDIDSSVLDLSELSPTYIYVPELKTYREQYDYAHLLSSYGCDSILLLYVQASEKETTQLTLELLLDVYSSVVTKDNYTLVDDNVSLYSSIKNPPLTFFKVKELLQYLGSISTPYIIFSDSDIPEIVVKIAALAFVQYKKFPIFKSSAIEIKFAKYVADVLYGRFGFEIDKLCNAQGQFSLTRTPSAGSFAIDVQDGWVSLVQLEQKRFNGYYYLVRASDLKTLIVADPKYHVNTLMNTKCSKYISLVPPAAHDLAVDKFDHNNINLFEHTSEHLNRWEPVPLVKGIEKIWGITPGKSTGNSILSDELSDWEDLCYTILRTLEQIFDLTSLQLLSNLGIVKDTTYSGDNPLEAYYIGVGKVEFLYTSRSIKIGLVNRVLSPTETNSIVVPLQLFYDYGTKEFKQQLIKAFKESNIPLKTFRVSAVHPVSEKEVDMLIYNWIIDRYTYLPFSWNQMPEDNASIVDYRLAESYTCTCREEWLPTALEEMTTYGFRLLSAKSSPITIYGGPNFLNRSQNGTGISLNWEVFKHTPKQERR